MNVDLRCKQLYLHKFKKNHSISKKLEEELQVLVKIAAKADKHAISQGYKW